MTQQDSSDWTIITAVATAVPIIGALIVAVLKSFFVTRAELKETIERLDLKVDKRHEETNDRLTKQDDLLRTINTGMARIEGQISGRYPTMKP